MVVCYLDQDSQGWLLEQLPPMIQQQLQKYIHIVGVIFLGVAASLVLMFALGIEILYFESKQTSARPRRSQGPGTYLLGDSDINNLIGYETGRRYKKVETREQASQYHLEGVVICALNVTDSSVNAKTTQYRFCPKAMRQTSKKCASLRLQLLQLLQLLQPFV